VAVFTSGGARHDERRLCRPLGPRPRRRALRDVGGETPPRSGSPGRRRRPAWGDFRDFARQGPARANGRRTCAAGTGAPGVCRFVPLVGRRHAGGLPPSSRPDDLRTEPAASPDRLKRLAGAAVGKIRPMRGPFPITVDLPSKRRRRPSRRTPRAAAPPGDTLLLGPIGAGKTHFARALIKARLRAAGRDEDVPSPTYTLVQTYDDGGTEIWHADLYRLQDRADTRSSASTTRSARRHRACRMARPAGRRRARRRAPPRLRGRRRRGVAAAHPHVPAMRAGPGGSPRSRDGRPCLTATPSSTPSPAAPDGATAERRLLAGDASNRRYLSLLRATGETAVLMDAAPERGEDVGPFLAIAGHLAALGLSAPGCWPRTCRRDSSCSRIWATASSRASSPRSRRARRRSTARPPRPSPAACRRRPRARAVHARTMADLARLVFDWYAPGAPEAKRATSSARLEDALALTAPSPRSRAPRLPCREPPLAAGPCRTRAHGLLDFQDAVVAHPAYDLVSLLHDARRDVTEATRTATIRHFLDLTGHAEAPFAAAAAALSAQRNLRILGVFARLAGRTARPAISASFPGSGAIWSAISPTRRFMGPRRGAAPPSRAGARPAGGACPAP
jgi:N-acetylmuramate 1-kinase